MQLERSSRSAAALLAACGLATSLAFSAAAEILELPAEWPLGIDSQLVFELDGADLYLKTRADGLPALRARVEAAGESAGLEVVSSGGSLTVRRADEWTEGSPRVRIDLALGPGRSVRVAGSDLVVRAEDHLPEGPGGGVRLALERSTAVLSGVRVAGLEAVESSVSLEGTEGALALTLDGGSAEVSGHRGRLDLDATEAGTVVAGHQGQIEADLEGGSLEIVGGDGTFAAILAGGAHLSFDDWRGPVEIRGRDGAVEARGGEYRDRWQIEGRELAVTLERLRGPVGATLEGGSLRGDDLAAVVQVTAAGARLDLVEIAGGVTLDLTDGAEAVLLGVASVEAKVHDSRLAAEGVDRLTLTGAGADVTISQVRHLEPIEIGDSQLSLDLRGGPGATLVLYGAGYASVRLSEPCVVQLSADRDGVGDQIGVAGCELRAADQDVPRHQDRRQYGMLPARLAVSLGPGAVLDVEGEPRGR